MNAIEQSRLYAANKLTFLLRKLAPNPLGDPLTPQTLDCVDAIADHVIDRITDPDLQPPSKPRKST